MEIDWATASDGAPAQLVDFTDDAAYGWFFDPANVESFVKVLDACAINQHYWVFLAGLTDVQVSVRVTDTDTGEVWTYSKELGAVFEPVLDTSALPVCP